MGIRGLTKFLEINQDCFKRCQLYDTSIVFDGNNLIYCLYFASKIDWTLGGEYTSLKTKIVDLINSLRDCGVRPYFIFDGCTHPDVSFFIMPIT